MKEIKQILLFGVLILAIGAICWMVKQHMDRASDDAARQTEQWKESFQAVAGTLAVQYRGEYDRPRYAKETRAQNQYARPRYAQGIVDTNSKKVKYVYIAGKQAWLHFAQIAVYDLNWTNVAPQSTPSSSGTYSDCHHHHHHGQHYHHVPAQHRDNHGCHDMRMSNVIDGDTGSPQNRWWDWGSPHTGGEGQRGGIYHSSSDSWPWFKLTLKDAIFVREVKLWQRYDSDRNRISGFVLKLLAADESLIKEYTLTSADVQSYAGPALTCPSGYRKIGGDYDTQCVYNCAAGEDRDDNARMCYKPCTAGDYLEGGMTGTCKTPCTSGFTLSGNTCYKDCVAPDTNIDTANCYKPCAAVEDDSRPPKCYRPCPSTHRFVINDGRSLDDQCYPIRPEDYLPIAWRGAILSQADPTVGLALSITDDKRYKDGGAVGTWGPIGTAASQNDSDQIWAYTENMEIVNMYNRKCMDTGTSGSNGPPVMWKCQGEGNQKWFIDSESRIRPLNNKSKCLTIANADITTTPLPPSTNPLVRILNNRHVRLADCTADGNKLQRFFTNGNRILPGARVAINGLGSTASAPPALPTEPINREGFLATRETEDAF